MKNEKKKNFIQRNYAEISAFLICSVFYVGVLWIQSIRHTIREVETNQQLKELIELNDFQSDAILKLNKEVEKRGLLIQELIQRYNSLLEEKYSTENKSWATDENTNDEKT
tara:strand:- start:1176 stop:1508 length:333 start_codon:yes stop_codon:yes gene_type:complete